MRLCEAADEVGTYVDEIADAWLAADAAELPFVDTYDGVDGEQPEAHSPAAGGSHGGDVAYCGLWCGTDPSRVSTGLSNVDI